MSTLEALVEFEEASFEGFEHAGAYKPGCWHAPASLDDPDMQYFTGRVDGQVVSASIALISDGVVGIFLGLQQDRLIGVAAMAPP